MGKKYDFSGWATRNNLKCSDGRTIIKNAFAHNDGQTVPLVWNHQHNDPHNILGHALLENRDDGVYAYGTFNDTESGQAAKQLVEHGDVVALSIYANKLKQQGGNVLHGVIREVSLVLAGANPGAFIESVICHGEESDEEAVIYTDENIEMHESENVEPAEEPAEETPAQTDENPGKTEEIPEQKQGDNQMEDEKLSHADEQTADKKEKTVQDVFDTLNEEQKNVVYAIIGQAVEDAKNEKQGEENMKHNVFENDNQENTLIHKDNGEALTMSDVAEIFSDAKRYGSLKDSALAHGVTNIDYLFPDDKFVGEVPGIIKRDTTWVSNFMSKVHHSPFSRIKSMFANLTEDEARAKGYIKGNLKKEQVFSLLKRSTTPTTVYKKQKLDRDDVVDIKDFDVVAWQKKEMRKQLDKELARAMLLGDDRDPSDPYKISELAINKIPVVGDLDSKIAKELSFIYVDTGALYRTVALHLLCNEFHVGFHLIHR